MCLKNLKQKQKQNKNVHEVLHSEKNGFQIRKLDQE